MRSIQTSFAFPLSSVKPLDRLAAYREFCLSETRKSLASGTQRRNNCAACGTILVPAGAIEDFEYGRCPDCSSLFLFQVPSAQKWSDLLRRVSEYRNSPSSPHAAIAVSRNENVYHPKLEWIQHTIRLHGLVRPRLLEMTIPPSSFSGMLHSSGAFGGVDTINESEADAGGRGSGFGAAVLLESLDRSIDPAALLKAARGHLGNQGLLFVTALVCSGFDLAVLGFRSFYLYPPDRVNCFSLAGLRKLVEQSGFTPVEVSTPGVLDVEIVRSHLAHDPTLPLSGFERQMINADAEIQDAFQTFLQENLLSSFARIVGRVQ